MAKIILDITLVNQPDGQVGTEISCNVVPPENKTADDIICADMTYLTAEVIRQVLGAPEYRSILNGAYKKRHMNSVNTNTDIKTATFNTKIH